MPQLNFISEKALAGEVQSILEVAISARKKAIKNIDRNVIDPFAALFEMAGFQANAETWLLSEQTRQAQKTLQNHIGNFHQRILGSVSGWTNLDTREVVDLVCPKKKIIAELKNKHNTVKKSDEYHIYDNLHNMVSKKGHKYRGFTAYYVKIIPLGAQKYNKEFIPPDNTTGSRRPANSLIREIDGYSFYELVTGEKDALKKLFQILLDTIKEYCKDYSFTQKEQSLLINFFSKAFD